MESSSNGARPLQGTSNMGSEAAILTSLIRTMTLRMRTALPVRVESVTNEGGLSPIGRVSILPLVQQVDGEGQARSHGVIFNVPYFRLHGGSNAVILDPEVGDIGMALFADRDISSVKATSQESPPGSSRTFDMTDAVYMGSILASAPTQYVQFNEDGISVVSPTKVTVQAPDIGLVGNVAASGGTLTHNGVNVGDNHQHSGVESGPSNTGGPIS